MSKKKQAPWEKEKNEKIIIKFVNQDYIFAEENNVLQMKKKPKWNFNQFYRFGG